MVYRGGCQGLRQNRRSRAATTGVVGRVSVLTRTKGSDAWLRRARVLISVVVKVGEVAGDDGRFGAAKPLVDSQRFGERCCGGREILCSVCAASQARQCVCLMQRGADGTGEGVGLGEQSVRVTGWG